MITSCVIVHLPRSLLSFKSFSYDNNLYIQSDPFGVPVDIVNRLLGRDRHVYYGLADWLYEGTDSTQFHFIAHSLSNMLYQ